ncbi:PG0541 family transporter-associated protein [Bacteroides heparinolyticus]|uniref:PG0541 family transporter-associated protein n=1 Tax=Prevotella heparinolytica TaxID=28113 RepID=UPI0035A178CF
MMKMIYCTCNVSKLDILLKALEELDVSDYQVVEQVIAKNRKGAPRFNTAIWPGYNSVITLQVREEEKVRSLAEKIKKMNAESYNEDELITFCSWTLDDYFFD